jgi:hypothetical protein
MPICENVVYENCRPTKLVAPMYTNHAEYPAFSVGENFSPDTAGHMPSNLCGLLPRPEAANPGARLK